MKTFLRMVSFAVIGYLVAFSVAGIVVLARMHPLPADISRQAAQGERSASLRVAVEAQRTADLANVVMWPTLAGTIYGLERLRRALRSQPAQPVRLEGLPRWLERVMHFGP
jgi:hypothetical protein